MRDEEHRAANEEIAHALEQLVLGASVEASVGSILSRTAFIARRLGHVVAARRW